MKVSNFIHYSRKLLVFYELFTSFFILFTPTHLILDFEPKEECRY